MAPPFTLSTPSTQTVRLSDYLGQVVLLNFWATWCPPCRVEMPAIERLYVLFKDRGFGALAVSVDTAGAETVASFATEERLTFPIALDPGMSVASRYGVGGFHPPFSWIVAAGSGRSPWDRASGMAPTRTP